MPRQEQAYLEKKIGFACLDKKNKRWHGSNWCKEKNANILFDLKFPAYYTRYIAAGCTQMLQLVTESDFACQEKKQGLHAISSGPQNTGENYQSV